jgi:hypothetical protein
MKIQEILAQEDYMVLEQDLEEGPFGDAVKNIAKGAIIAAGLVAGGCRYSSC